MSSNSGWRPMAMALLFGMAPLAGQDAPPSPAFTCPASLTPTAAAPAPWRAEGVAKTQHKFLRPSLYNGEPGKTEYELAPDDDQITGRQVRQSWKLTDYRDMNLFVRCRYTGTSVTLVANLPAKLKICTFSFQYTGGKISAPVFGCR